MAGAYNNNNIDIVNVSYLSAVVNVSTTQVALRVGGSNLSRRQIILIHNPPGNGPIYVGPTGVTTSTGVRISAGETTSYPLGDTITIFAIKTGATQGIIVQEFS